MLNKSEIQIFSHAYLGDSPNRRIATPQYTENIPAMDHVDRDFGLQIVGVFLLGAEANYRRFSWYCFHDESFRYKNHSPTDITEYIPGSSFAVVTIDQGKVSREWEIWKTSYPQCNVFYSSQNLHMEQYIHKITINKGDSQVLL